MSMLTGLALSAPRRTQPSSSGSSPSSSPSIKSETSKESASVSFCPAASSWCRELDSSPPDPDPPPQPATSATRASRGRERLPPAEYPGRAALTPGSGVELEDRVVGGDHEELGVGGVGA